MLLQTQVFVRGRCVGKRAISYADKISGGFTDQQKEQLLRDQHRLVLDAIRDGKLNDVLDKRDTPEALAAIKELDVQWLNADSVHSERSLVMRLKVTEAGSGAAGARLTVRFARPDAAPFYTQVVTDPAGEAEMKHRGRRVQPHRFFHSGASQLLRPHRDPQISVAKSGSLSSAGHSLQVRQHESVHQR